MNNLEKYVEAFKMALEVDESVVRGLKYQGVEAWDSIGHMSLVGELEEMFDIEFDTDDIIAFSSFEKGIEILNKYGIDM